MALSSAPRAGNEGLRQRKKAATRKALRDAAMTLFNERGVDSTTIEQIADRANVSRSTFFRYFNSKDAVIFSDGEEQGPKFMDSLKRRPPQEGPVEAFEAALIELAGSQDREDEKPSWRNFDELLQNDPNLRARVMLTRAGFTEQVAQVFATRRGRATPEGEDRLAASVCMAAVEESGQAWRQQSGPDAVEAVRSAFRLLGSLLGNR